MNTGCKKATPKSNTHLPEEDVELPGQIPKVHSPESRNPARERASLELSLFYHTRGAHHNLTRSVLRPLGCGSKPTVPFWGFRCTTHFRTYFSGWIESDVHWGMATSVFCGEHPLSSSAWQSAGRPTSAPRVRRFPHGRKLRRPSRGLCGRLQLSDKNLNCSSHLPGKLSAQAHQQALLSPDGKDGLAQTHIRMWFVRKQTGSHRSLIRSGSESKWFFSWTRESPWCFSQIFQSKTGV